MKKVSLSGSLRANVGKKDASALRKEGRVPCVVYGGKEQTAFHVSEIELKKIVWSPSVYSVELNLDGKIIPARPYNTTSINIKYSSRCANNLRFRV